MTRGLQSCFFLIALLTFAMLSVSAQNDDTRFSPMGRQNDDKDLPQSVKETRSKMRIEKEKKDHDEMLDRADEVRRLSERLERSFAHNGRLSGDDLTALETVEKNAKKIRSELGGSDDDEKLDAILRGGQNAPLVDVIGTLKSAAISLSDQVKETSRFSISASAIQSSNAVLTVARFLRIKN